MIRVLIAEDEAISARRLTKLLSAYDDIEVVQHCDSLEDLRSFFQSSTRVDLCFFDIQLSDGVVFELFEEETIEEPVIFTTAYDQYAIKAFKQNSIDYLLKPIDKEELTQALIKYRNLHLSQGVSLQGIKELLSQSQSDPQQYKERMLVKIGEQYKSIPLSEISHIYSEDKVTWVSNQGRSYPVDYTLQELVSQLDPSIFFQINRGCTVNFNHIQKINQHSSSRLKLYVKNDDSERMAVAKDRVARFKKWLDR